MKEYELSIPFWIMPVAVYLVLSAVGLLIGLFDAGLNIQAGCHAPSTRIGHAFPAYRVGCWLGEVP